VIDDRPIAAVRPSKIQALVQTMSAQLAPSTVEVVYGRVVAVFRAAVRDRVVTISPCIDIRRPAKTGAEVPVLSRDQIFAMAASVPERYRGLVLAGAGTGLRPGELFGLTVDRVDFLRRTIRVDQQLVRVQGEGVSLAPLKAASYRTLPLASVIGDGLAAHLSRWPARDNPV